MQESRPSERALPGSLPDKTEHCDKHGQYQAKHIFGTHWGRCPTCDAECEERVRVRREQTQERERQERAKKILARNLRHSGIADRFSSATFDTFVSKTQDQAEVAKGCREFVEAFDPSGGNALWLIGAPGTGKTHLGSAMVNHMIRERRMGACIHGVHEIMAMLRARWGVRTGSAWWDDDAIATTDDLLAHLGQVPLLVLDEIGVTKGTDDELKNLFTIVDERYRQLRPTVVLSNLAPNEMKPILGERSYDRLRENAKLLVCKWPSQRGLAQGQ